MKSHIIFLLVLVSVSCNTPLEKQSKSLLPEEYKIKLDTKVSKGLTTTFVYTIIGEIDNSSLVNYPRMILDNEEKEIVQWHKPSENELVDINRFLVEEQSSIDLNNIFIENLRKGECLISVISDLDREPIGSSGYSTSDWMELYVIYFSENKLVHISYGKF